MGMKRTVFSCLFFLFLASVIHSQPAVDDKLKELLSGYLSNDLQLKKYTLEAQKKALALSSVKIDNGIDVSLSSGNVSITTDMSDSTKITFTPSVSAAVPQANNLSLDFSLPYTVEDGNKTVDGGSLSVSVGIISDAAKKRNLSILEAERALLEAKRNVTDRAVSAEKEFYSALKSLYNYAITIQTKKNDLYDDTVDLKVLETQGYSKTSAKYRQASLQVDSDRRAVHEYERLFERETAIFAMKCGKTFTRSSAAYDEKKEKGEAPGNYDPEKAGNLAYESAMAFLPDSIPKVKAERIFEYDRNTYSKTESAAWDKYIGELTREADYDMTLTATGEYKFNSNTSGYDDAGGKLSFNWKGISASAGAYVPTGKNTFDSASSFSKNDNPYFQFSLTLTPNEWRMAGISKQQDAIDAQIEDIAINDAHDDYEEEILAKVSTFHDIKWSERSYEEEYDMYTKLESDMAKWLEQGIVTENDYLDAKCSREKARLNIIINAIDLIIYNDEVKLLFHAEADGVEK